jgi:hypothetical protein
LTSAFIPGRIASFFLDPHPDPPPCGGRGLLALLFQDQVWMLGPAVEVPELFQLRRISEQGLSHLADNVVLLQYVQEGPELVRALTVLKTRAMHHHPVVYRYDITEKGFVLGDVLTLTR